MKNEKIIKELNTTFIEQIKKVQQDFISVIQEIQTLPESQQPRYFDSLRIMIKEVRFPFIKIQPKELGRYIL